MSITLRSPAFQDGEPIPTRYTGDGNDVSPPLTWSSPPKGTVELALLVDDPDAPRDEPWVHWILSKIPAGPAGLPEGFHESTVPPNAPKGLVHGANSWGSQGYRGPAPPKGHGVHHYHFKLYALDAALEIAPGVDKHTLLEAISGHVLARGELVGTYQRS